jgi:hypothetical protein
MDIKFPHQPGPMRLSRLYADSQERSNFFTRLAFADKLKNLAFPRGKWIRWKCRFGQKRLYNRAGNTGAKINLSTRSVAA